MKLIIQIAWRNLWRYPTRSATIICGITLGIWASTFMMAFNNGLQDQRIQDFLENSIAHIKIQHPNYDREKLVYHYLNHSDSLSSRLQSHPEIRAVSPRLNTYGLATGKNANYRVDIYGITPQAEKNVFSLYQKIKVGTYLDQASDSSAVIGQKLAQRLELKLNDRLKLSFSDQNGENQSAHFRVAGIYQTSNTSFEQSHVFIHREVFAELLNLETAAVHQLACRLRNLRKAHQVEKDLTKKWPDLRVKSWIKTAPELAYLHEIMTYFYLIFLGIIILAMSLVIMNVMLMAILERKQELALLSALGMPKQALGWMVSMETFLLSVIGSLLGLGLSSLTIRGSAAYGIHLSHLRAGVASAGFDSVVKPYLSGEVFLMVIGFVMVATLILSIYLVRKVLATRLVKVIS